ncbi:hypothetical protein BDN72DRAFT_630665 [Pluteus cervinus]|uniref:Uncharacterized protein n=1 Tax=Pluteus cervinus TaxID=181527 RepID=A0ACD3BAA3_9AGAR|nr:hypothetical protein BDN72DRAFT_630665 [Pluteus cervinus]
MVDAISKPQDTSQLVYHSSPAESLSRLSSSTRMTAPTNTSPPPPRTPASPPPVSSTAAAAERSIASSRPPQPPPTSSLVCIIHPLFGLFTALWVVAPYYHISYVSCPSWSLYLFMILSLSRLLPPSQSPFTD